MQGVLGVLVRRYCGPFWIRRRQLARTQWLDEQTLSKLQVKLLRGLLQHCWSSVPYYRCLMEETGVRAEDIQHPEDIRRLPILTKQQVLEAGSAMTSSKHGRWLRRTAYTGGTTGTPMPLQRDLLSISNEHAFVRRQYDWAGLGLRDRCAYLTGRLIARPDATEHLHAYDPFMNELILSTYHLSPRTATDYMQRLVDYRVKGLVGYPSAVHLLAQTCLEAGVKVPLRAVLTSSETLAEPMRKTISEVFCCPVFNFYGSAERVCYIFTCEKGSYHVIPEYGMTELIPVDEAHPQRCRIISTGFWNKAMPLIRYDLGDVVTRSERVCSCGRAFQAVEQIEGRQVEGIRTPSGRQYGAAMLTHLLYGTGTILESQIVQDAVDHVTIEYVPSQRFSGDDMNEFQKLIRMHLPTELRVEFKAVDAVRRTVSGKIRPVVSLLAEHA
jgi:phenylacetate-CoA ligase